MAYTIPPTASELLEQILQQLKDIKGVMTREHTEQKIGLELSPVQLDGLVKEVQAALLRNAKRSPRTGLRLNPPGVFPEYDDEDEDDD
jgi:hypothetical protein